MYFQVARNWKYYAKDADCNVTDTDGMPISCSDKVSLLSSAKSTHSYVYKVQLDYIGHSTEAAKMPYGANAKMLRLTRTLISHKSSSSPTQHSNTHIWMVLLELN